MIEASRSTYTFVIPALDAHTLNLITSLGRVIFLNYPFLHVLFQNTWKWSSPRIETKRPALSTANKPLFSAVRITRSFFIFLRDSAYLSTQSRTWTTTHTPHDIHSRRHTHKQSQSHKEETYVTSSFGWTATLSLLEQGTLAFPVCEQDPAFPCCNQSAHTN